MNRTTRYGREIALPWVPLWWCVCAFLSLALWSGGLTPVRADIQGIDETAYSALPLFVDFSASASGGSASFMLAMSRDEQLFFKAYSDYSDLDRDGVIDNSYNHNFEYYGLFDPQKCYSYDDTDQRFEPEAFSRTDTSGDYTYECNTIGRYWSGNFMNWATTVRLEVVQKVLYGGRRSTDSATETVLEGAYLLPDSHSFAKYIDDSTLIERVTPVQWTAAIPNSQRSLTICRTSGPGSSQSGRTDSTAFSIPPQIKIVYGDFRLWDLQSATQCTRGTSSFRPAIDGIDAFRPLSRNAPSAFRYIGGDGEPNASSNTWTWTNHADLYLAHRVQVCVPAYINSDNREGCKQYPDGNFKPIGIIQRYGETGTADFGLMMTSYRDPHQGGLLRRRMGELGNTEVDADDGTFATYSFADIPAAGLLIQTLDSLYISVANVTVSSLSATDRTQDLLLSPFYKASSATSATERCSAFLWSELNPDCASWGNPFAEMLQETVRYLSGHRPPQSGFRTRGANTTTIT